MPNTFDSALTTDYLALTAQTALQNLLAPLRAFSRDFGTDPLKPLATVQVPLITSGPTVQTDPTNFESGDCVVDNIPVTVHHYSASVHTTSGEQNSGSRIEDLVEVCAGSLADKIIDAAFAPLSVANLGEATILSAAAAFGGEEIKTLWSAISKAPQKALVLDGDYYARLLSTDLQSFDVTKSGTLPGWNSVSPNTRWTAAATDMAGFASSPAALAVAGGLPLLPVTSGKGGMATTSFTLQGLGLAVQLNRWIALSTRTSWLSLDVMFGAAIGQPGALKWVKRT